MASSYNVTIEPMTGVLEYEEQLTKRELLGICIAELRDYEIWRINVRTFVANITEYAYNNPINKEHVTYLSDEIAKSKLVIGPLSTVEIIDNKIRLLDGHHRLHALKKLEPEVLDMLEILVFNYKCSNRQEIMNFFHRLNTVKPFSLIDITGDKDCLYIIDTLKRKNPGFTKCIKDNSTRVNWPNIMEKTFKLQLQARLKALVNYDVTNVIEQILIFNDTLLKKPKKFKTLYNGEPVPKDADDRYQKAYKSGFMLAFPEGNLWPSYVKG